MQKKDVGVFTPKKRGLKPRKNEREGISQVERGTRGPNPGGGRDMRTRENRPKIIYRYRGGAGKRSIPTGPRKRKIQRRGKRRSVVLSRLSDMKEKTKRRKEVLVTVSKGRIIERRKRQNTEEEERKGLLKRSYSGETCGGGDDFPAKKKTSEYRNGVPCRQGIELVLTAEKGKG